MTKTTKVRIISLFLVFILIGSILILGLDKLGAFADESEPLLHDNVAYFEGRGSNLDDDAIHKLTRLPKYSNDAPSITVLVHGQGGNASHWENDENYNLAYDETSLVETLRDRASDANVYWARMSRDSDNNGLDDRFWNEKTEIDPKTHEEKIIEEQFFPYISNRFFLTKLEKNNYKVNNASISEQSFVTELTEINKHSIILFESAVPSSYHRDVYEEIHTIIDRLSYDILCLTGRIPTVNLISHSRGGLTSMLYATGYHEDGKLKNVEYVSVDKDGYAVVGGSQIKPSETDGYKDVGDNYFEKPNEYNSASAVIHDHPFNVAELYSMGTPYHGTDWDKDILFGVSHSILSGSFSNPSAKNILDEDIQNEIQDCWERAVDKNPALKLNAIAGTFDLSFIIGLLAEDYSAFIAMEKIEFLQGKAIKVLLDTLSQWGELASIVITAVDMGFAAGTGALINVPYVGWILAIPMGALTISVAVADAAIITATERLHQFEARFAEQLKSDTITDQTIYTELSFVLADFIYSFKTFGSFIAQFTDGDSNLVHDWGDLFIDTKSQEADGFSNVEVFEKNFIYSLIDYTVNDDNNCVITYEYKSFEFKKNCPPPAIPHNLETRDSEIINHICSKIELSTPSTIYNYFVLPDDTVKIVDVILPDYYFDNNTICESLSSLELSLEAKFNGKVVSYIENYAFANFTNLKSIKIPDSVTVIGSRAFENCTSLTGEFVLPARLNYYGAAVFSNCPQLTKLTIDTSNTKYYTIDGVLYTHNSYCTNDGLDYDVVKASYGETLLEYPNGKSTTTFTVPIDVVNIADYAISNNAHIQSISLNNVKNIGTKAFKDSNNLTYVVGGEKIQYVGEKAFYATKWLNNNKSTYVGLGEVLIKYNGAEKEVTLDHYNSISADAFYGNNSLQKVIMSSNVKYIGQNAFSNCKILTSVKVLNLDRVVELGENAFDSNAINRIIYLPKDRISQYESNVNWTKYSNAFKAISTIISFEPDGGIKPANMNAYYGSSIELPSSSMEGNIFSGWYLNNSEIKTGDIWNIAEEETTLKAKWTLQKYHINLDLMDGENGTTEVDVTYSQGMPTGNDIIAPTKKGHTFGGYYSGKDGTGTQYYSATMSSMCNYNETHAIPLYAFWIANKYEVTFDFEGGWGGTKNVTATYGYEMPSATAPELQGMGFVGYFTEQGDQYYTNEMKSFQPYNIDGPITLHAHWEIKKFKIELKFETSQWVEINSPELGLSDQEKFVQLGAEVNGVINDVLIEAYLKKFGERPGKTLLGFCPSDSDSGKFIDWEDVIPDIADHLATVELKPVWVSNKYTVTFNLQDSIFWSDGADGFSSPTLASMNRDDIIFIHFIPQSSGQVTFWTSHTSGDPYLILYNDKKVLLHYNDDGQGNNDSRLSYNVNSGTSYYIGFRAFGSSRTVGTLHYSGLLLNSSRVEIVAQYEETLSMAPVLTKTGHTFMGYYTEPNGKGDKIYEASGVAKSIWNRSKDTILYPYFTANYYTVNFDWNGGYLKEGSRTVKFGTAQTIDKPILLGYTFTGLYLEENGNEIQIFDRNGYCAKWSLARNVTLRAHWDASPYTVTLDMQGGTVSQSAFAGSLTTSLISFNREETVYIYFVPQTSGQITLWTSHNSGDPYLELFNSNMEQIAFNDDGRGNRDAEIVYSVIAGESYYVGFRAFYGEKTVGCISYSGVSINSSAVAITVKYGANMPKVLVPTKSGYEFAGYNTKADGSGEMIYDKDGVGINKWIKTSNIKLYALWSATTYTCTNTSSPSISGTTSIVDLSNAQTYGTYVFYINSSVSEVTFKSNGSLFTSMRIYVYSRSTPLTVRLINTRIIAPNNNYAIYGYSDFALTIAYEGTCSLTGGYNTSRGNGQGFAAIYNANSKASVTLKGTGTLTITGGKGATGYDGTAGSQGANGNDVTGAFLGNGTAGSNGLAGTNGGTGGIGGYAVYISSLIIKSTTGSIYLNGGQGGAGGRGGDGGDGGRGGHAQGSGLIAQNGGDGGNGGNGGRGGDGGAGGAYSNVAYNKPYDSYITPIVSTGLQGIGGRGGNGGDGGAGGANGPSWFTSGQHGEGGTGGSAGAGGSGSTYGSYGISGAKGGYYTGHLA